MNEGKLFTLIDSAMDEIKLAFHPVSRYQEIPFNLLRSNVLPVILRLSEHPFLSHYFNYMEDKDTYTYRHSIGVAIITHAIGLIIDFDQQELVELTEAGFLHDIGKAKIPEEIINKPGALTDEEYAIIQNHTCFGYEIMKNIPILTYRQALVALQHHEREDGRGYPFRLRGEEINHHSKIVAIADVFHAMISKRSYKSPVPIYKVLFEITESRYGTLDPSIFLPFVKKIMNYMIGNEVLLSNGMKGKITHIPSNDPVRPLIQTDGVYLDLRSERSIQLLEVI
ncbi:HD-GYP domain-containing protein [Paenibacillus physcomitrellae]|uniref:HD-GYP domain-containing protein n=1 Tax=Paenibacillus physcomitrellae TaxID=1619311 RepID=A0ABQ1FQK8_9BACL|nr:HD-GYP domain-containing protein [Paenibacillus physcomitrellae]GGA26178.1 hypothetical protein GCM10010917_08780 [Paenibacillus physcomitrellae]